MQKPLPDLHRLFLRDLEKAVARISSGRARIVIPEAVGLHRRRPGAHFHPTPEFFLQTGGASDFECPSGKFRLKTGDLCIMPAGVPHAEKPLNLRTRYRLLVLMRHAEGFIALHGTSNRAEQIASENECDFAGGGTAFEFLEHAARVQTVHRTLRPLFIEGLTGAFLASILTEIRNPRPRTTVKDSPLVLEAVRTVRVNISDPGLSVQSVATRLGCSPDHLTRLFRIEHGMSLGVWIARERVQLARDLLVHPGHNIAEIGRACGFSSSTYFIRVFKAHTGTTPKIWRTLTLESGLGEQNVPGGKMVVSGGRSP